MGVSHHYGLYMSLGYALIMQGVMSSLYHTCPNSVTIKFGMWHLYVIFSLLKVGLFAVLTIASKYPS